MYKNLTLPFPKCCESDGGCCADVIVDSVLKVDVRIAMVISLTVIVACVVSGLTVIVCCFCSGCPMYDTCSGSWDQSTTTSSKKNGQALPWDYTRHVLGPFWGIVPLNKRLFERFSTRSKAGLWKNFRPQVPDS